MVKMLDSEQFIKSIGNMMAVKMDLSIYNGSFDCACGKSHPYSPFIKLLAQGKWRVVMVCPNDSNYLTNVSIKTGFMGFRFKGFESISGIEFKDDADKIGMLYAFQNLN